MKKTFEISGTLTKIMETKEFLNDFKIKEFLIKTDETYSQLLLFKLISKKCSLINTFNIGDIINITFTIESKSWKNNLNKEYSITSFNVVQLNLLKAKSIIPEKKSFKKFENDYSLSNDFEEDYDNSSSYETDWSNYDDNLDMDQQSEDFWNQF